MKKIFYSLALLISVFASCKKDKPEEGPDVPPPGELTQKLKLPLGAAIGNAIQKEIGGAGGTIQSSDGVIKVTIPAGALDGTTTFSVQEVENTLGTRAKSYRLRPEGVNFKKAVTISYRYAGIDLGSVDPRMFFLAFQDKDGYYYSANKTKGNLNDNTLTVETMHFSDWTFYSQYDIIASPARIEEGKVYLRESEDVKIYVTSSARSEGKGEVDDLLVNLYDPVIAGAKWEYSPRKGALTIGEHNAVVYKAPPKISKTEEIVVTATLTGDLGKDNQGNPVKLMQLVQPVVLENDDYFLLTESGVELAATRFDAELIPGMGIQIFANFVNGYNFSAYLYGTTPASYSYNQHGAEGAAVLELVPEDQRGFVVFRPKECLNGGDGLVYSPGAMIIKSIGHSAGKYFEGEFSCTMYRFDYCSSGVSKAISGRFKIRKQG
jgi:hypothetical protein